MDADHRLLVTHALDVAGLVRAAAARPDTQDHSGYRRYDAGAVVELIRIETLAGAGVPPARLRAQSRQRERHRARIARLASGRPGGAAGGGIVRVERDAGSRLPHMPRPGRRGVGRALDAARAGPEPDRPAASITRMTDAPEDVELAPTLARPLDAVAAPEPRRRRSGRTRAVRPDHVVAGTRGTGTWCSGAGALLLVAVDGCRPGAAVPPAGAPVSRRRARPSSAPPGPPEDAGHQDRKSVV